MSGVYTQGQVDEAADYLSSCFFHAGFMVRRELGDPVEAIDAAHLERQRDWSRGTFGPGDRTAGVIDHIRKELVEVAENPDDASEWADLIILAFDGALRRGIEPQRIIDAVVAKQAKNEARTWPDWRGLPTDKAIEHDRSVAS